jgi:23S rRNA (cytosine1962-C5)-methyltransferase
VPFQAPSRRQVDGIGGTSAKTEHILGSGHVRTELSAFLYPSYLHVPPGHLTGTTATLRGLARGATMLNLFSYSGAFSVAALAGGAARSVDVDTSEPALELAREQRADNGFDIEKSDFVRADVFEDLRRRTAARESWDIVVCDPPAFAKKKGDIDRAARGYQDVNRLAMMLVRPGGWLLTCSCSGLVGADLFQKIVFAASVEARRSFTLVARQGAGPDHPVSLDCPEGEYLKGMWLRRAN